MPLNRRDLLRYGALATAATALPLGGNSVVFGAPAVSDFAKIVAAYRELQIGQKLFSPKRNQAVAALDQVAVGYDSAMNVAADQLWPDLPVGPGSTYFPLMYYRLRTIAVDWATPGSALSGRPDQPQRIITALNTLYRLQYNENTAELGNWYVYEIGVPYWLLQILVCLGDALPAADLQRLLRPVLRFVADPNQRTATRGLVETGANRADKSLIAVVSGALAGDAARIATGLAAVTDTVGGGAASLVARVTTGDGYHTDGSFIQHGTVPYSGHYGLVLLTAAAGLMHVTNGTATPLPADVRQRFYDTVTDVYAPFLFAGSMMEPVRGRMLSRQGETGHDAGHQFIAATVLLSRNAPEPVRGTLAGLAAKWIREGTWAPYLDVSGVQRFSGGLQMVGVPEVEYAEQLLASRPRRPATTAVHRPFPQQDRMVHVTEDWSAALGLSSTRICRYEAINGQNLHGWYVGDGSLYTFLPGDQGHYSDAYWPTVDATLLPGTTEKDAAPPAFPANPPPATTSFAGGARWDDGHGAYGLDFVSQDGTLRAKKSWFFTPDAVVCLGAGITDASGARVRTTIENRNLGENGSAALIADGRRYTTLGQSVTLPRADWLHLAGIGGYVLLGDAPVTVRREDRTGTWLGIDIGANTHGTNVPYTRRFQQIVLDHGPNPAGATYAYAVLPGATAWQTRHGCERWRVLANTPGVQAVRLGDDEDSGTVAATFFAAGSVGPVGVSAPATVLWGETERGWRLAVADPTQTLDTIRVTVDRPRRRLAQSDPTVTVVATEPKLVLDIKVAGSLGATHTVTVR
ncbi:polysaccharide lyase 8 family protein [Solihabitans fulvus]|uniref:Polysaccharide lyase 8 family protein n=1 Tax=Solihabitans fulvus TaxID=1892852 RepID=A0A5B2XDE1_9PSEU|nr:polysaccharide lyase 8 family protein [Solihabitans fulvus]KAA2261049.1 polysaccharide lyase 8 family protein [Solihabitans fulvus]